jgi:hypothetical protein
MALDNIFSLFGFPDKDDEDRKKIEAELDVFKETPHFKLGMFHKLIMNGSLFSKQVVKFFAKADPGLDVKGIDQAGEYMMFTRAWFWIEQVQIRKKEWKEALKQYASEEFIISIKLSINYFESTEEYEKCAHLKKIQDFVEKNLDK